MQHDREAVVATIREKFLALSLFDVREPRLWAVTESRTLGRGGDQWISTATDSARATIRKGRAELGPTFSSRSGALDIAPSIES